MATVRFGGSALTFNTGENTLEAQRQAAAAAASANEAATSVIDAAASAAVALTASGPNYASIAEGNAATVAGQTFTADNGDGTISVYAHGAATTADALRKLIKDPGAATAAAMMGTADGDNGQAALDARRKQIGALTAVQATAPTLTQLLVDTTGYATANDTGGAPFVRVGAEPTHDLKFQDDAGNWYELFVEDRIPARAFGIGIGGDDVAAMNRLIAYLNAKGDVNRNGYKMLGVDFGQCNLIDVTAGGIDALLVSNVAFIGGPDTHVQILAGPFLTLGQATPTALMCENIFTFGFIPTVDPAATVGGVGQAAFVKIVKAARVFIDGVHPYNLPHIVYGDLPATGGASSIWVQNVYGLGNPDYSWVHFVNNNGATGASLYISRVSGYPYAPPTNPALVPKAVTGITQASPGVVTCAAHGFATGARVRLGDIVGMIELNGVDVTITKIDANSYSIGVDTTAYTAYTSGGWNVELHWAWQHDVAAVYIEGQWDTLRLSKNLIQHWAYFYELKANATENIAFVYDWGNLADYVGESRYKVTLGGGSISHWQISDGWTFALNGPFDKYTRTGGYINNQTISGHQVGLVGGDVFADTGSGWRYRNIKNVEVHGCGRAKSGTTYGVNCAGGNNEWDIGGVQFMNPDDFYGAGASSYLNPETCVHDPGSAPRLSIDGLEARATSRYFDITTATTSTKRRRFAGCTRSDGALAGTARLVTIAVAAGATAWRNKTGQPVHIWPNGASVVFAGTSYLDSSGVEQTATYSGSTTGPWLVGIDQLFTVNCSGSGTMRAFTVNL